MSGDPLNDGGVHGTEHEKEKPAAAQILQGKGDQQPADAVQNAQRTVQNAAILILAVYNRCVQHLAQPA